MDYQEEGSVDLAFIWGFIGVFVGAKVLYLFTVLPSLTEDVPQLFSSPIIFLKTYFQGGFVFYGGFYGGVIAVYLYSKVSKRPIGKLIYALLPGGIFAHALGRIGCFLEGCCYGRPTNSFIGVCFTNSEIAPNNIPLIPVQLIEASVEIILFLIVLYMRKKNAAPVFLLSFYMTLYGAARFCIEFYRFDDYRGFIGFLSLSQIISIITIFIGLLLYFRQKYHPSETCAAGRT